MVDTNVLAYYLFKTEPLFSETASFWRRVQETLAPDSWRIELVNALWLGVRQGIMDETPAQRRLMFAEKLVTETVSVAELHQVALHLAIRYGHPVYDTVLVALAKREGLPLATYDSGILKAFPELAQRPNALMRGL